jgi:hypothetical protein
VHGAPGPLFGVEVVTKFMAALHPYRDDSSASDLRSVVRVQCEASWEEVRELNDYVARYVGRRLASSSAERARFVISELLDTAVGAARAESKLGYELMLHPRNFSTFSTSVAIDMVPERARLLGGRVHKLMQLPVREACKTILAAIAQGKEDENCLPLARIRSEGMHLDCAEVDGGVKIVASTQG